MNWNKINIYMWNWIQYLGVDLKRLVAWGLSRVIGGTSNPWHFLFIFPRFFFHKINQSRNLHLGLIFGAGTSSSSLILEKGHWIYRALSLGPGTCLPHDVMLHLFIGGVYSFVPHLYILFYILWFSSKIFIFRIYLPKSPRLIQFSHVLNFL